MRPVVSSFCATRHRQRPEKPPRHTYLGHAFAPPPHRVELPAPADDHQREPGARARHRAALSVALRVVPVLRLGPGRVAARDGHSRSRSRAVRSAAGTAVRADGDIRRGARRPAADVGISRLTRVLAPRARARAARLLVLQKAHVEVHKALRVEFREAHRQPRRRGRRDGGRVERVQDDVEVSGASCSADANGAECKPARTGGVHAVSPRPDERDDVVACDQ